MKTKQPGNPCGLWQLNSVMGKTTGRLWEIDFLRGIALILMIFFHVLFDLNEIYGFKISYNSGVYFYIGKLSVILFMLISAVSSSFTRNNTRRAGKFLLIAIIITVVSHSYDPRFGIKFGILHFLGISILLYPLFRDINKYILAVLGTIIIILGQYLGNISVQHNYLFIFNLTGSSWVSADYYPLFPWFGVFLYGIALEKIFYQKKRSLLTSTPPENFITFTGQHTLLIYLIHQPVLLLIIGLYIKIIS